MDDLSIRWRHSPLYEAGHPVYPDGPVVPSPLLLRKMRNWHWEVEIEVHTLQYFVEGHGCHEVDNRSYPINPGDCFLFRPGQQVRGSSLDEQPFTFFAAHFDQVTPEARVDHLLHASIHEISLMESIHGDLAGNWPVGRMCEQVRLSRSQLNRWFNSLTGMSPTRYVIHQRVTRAVELVTMTRRSTEEIARELGYRDVHFFTRQFTSVMGRPPGECRGRGRPG